MITLSKQTDYALLALSYMARLDPERTASTREIADSFSIPSELLAKILQRLTRAQIAASSAGPAGGYRLARQAYQINISAVIEAVDGPMAFTHCLKTADNGCEQHDKCTIRGPLTRIHERILQMLSLITLDEIIREEASNVSYPMLSLSAHIIPVNTPISGNR